LESALREHGCHGRKVDTLDGVERVLEDADLVVVSRDALVNAGVFGQLAKAPDSCVLFLTHRAEAVLRAAGRSGQDGPLLPRSESGPELFSLLAAAAHGAASGDDERTDSHGAPVSKEGASGALSALVEAAENLVPMQVFQRIYVDYALRRFGGNKVHTAAALGIDRRTIQRWARDRAESVHTPVALVEHAS
jgi:hypothetical protein